jgi:hypothetical protein
MLRAGGRLENDESIDDIQECLYCSWALFNFFMTVSGLDPLIV